MAKYNSLCMLIEVLQKQGILPIKNKNRKDNKMKNKEIFERNKETLKLMLSDKGFVFTDYTMLSTVQCIEYARKYNDYTITIVLHTDNTLKLKICNDTTKNLIISKRLKPKDSSEIDFIVAITKLYNFINSFTNIFTKE